MSLKDDLPKALTIDHSTTQVTVSKGGYYTLSARETDRLNLAVAFTLLPDTYKQVLIARVLEDEPLEAVANSLGISPRTVQRRVKQGLQFIEAAIK